MLKIIKLDTIESVPKKYPYQLLIWQNNINDVMEAASQFVENECEDKAIIVHTPNNKWTIFTTGEDMEEETKKEEYNVERVLH